MQAFFYPSKIAFFGGYANEARGYTNGVNYYWYGDRNAYSYGFGVLSASAVVADPNGFVIKGTGIRVARDTRTQDCYGAIRSHYADEDYNGNSAWTVGKGYKHVIKRKVTYGGKGGDLFCLFIQDTVQNKQTFDFGYTLEGRYEKANWPYEKIVTMGNNAGGGSRSGSTLQLANGYFTGPPTYRTTGKREGYSIQNKTSLVYTSTKTDITILVTGPHATQKSKPENFLWVAGGVGGGDGYVGTRVEEACIVYYDFRGDFGFGGGWPNYRRFLIPSLTKSHLSSAQNFTLGGIQRSIPFSQITKSTSWTYPRGRGEGFSTMHERCITQKPITHLRGTSRAGNTIYWSSSAEDELWPIIDTYSTTYESQFYSKYSGFSYNVAKESVPIIVWTYDLDGDLVATTSSGNEERNGYATEMHQRGNYSSSGYNENGEQHQTYYRNYEHGYCLTMPLELGYIHRKHETSKRGYFYTDPDNRFKNAKDVGDSLDLSTYQCYDAQCIDFKLYADAQAFQTAKTYNNSAVLATRKQPRNASRRTMHTLTLESVQDFKTLTKAKTNNADPIRFATPAMGFAKQINNEYGEIASYNFSGFTTSKDSTGTATKLVPDGKNTYFVPMLYDSVDLRLNGWAIAVNAPNYYPLQPQQGV